MKDFESLKDFAIHEIEPHFVRGDGKCPVKHHLYSYISFIIITRNKPSKEVEKAIQMFDGQKIINFLQKDTANCVLPVLRRVNIILFQMTAQKI